MFSRPSPKKAFTLLELIVVIVVLGVLAAIAIPTFRAVIDRSEDSATLSTLKAVAREVQALEAFDQDGWDVADVEAAAADTAAASVGVQAAGVLKAVPDAGADPAEGELVYLIDGEGLALSLRSDSGRICVLGASASALSEGSCGVSQAASGKSTLGTIASSGTGLYPAGTKTSDTGTGPGTGPGTGTGPGPVVVKAPGAPTDVTAVADDKSAEVSFSAPSSTGGAPITQYFVYNGSTQVAAGTASPIKVAGLTNGTSYTFTVTAVNSAGESTPSVSAPPVTPAPPKVDVSGELATFAGSNTAGAFNNPRELLTVGDKLYVVELGSNKILQVDISTQAVSTLAGSGLSGNTNGAANVARFHQAWGAASDGTYLYVSEFSGQRIRKIELSTGTVSTLAGSGTSGSVDGIGTAARFNSPTGLHLAGSTLYVAERGGGKVRAVDINTGEVTTVVSRPLAADVVVDGNTMYVSGGNRVDVVDLTTKSVTLYAGSTTAGFADGSLTDARFYDVFSMELSGSNLYVTDFKNNRLRKIDLVTKTVSTVAGDGTDSSVDGGAGAGTVSGPLGITAYGRDLFIGQSTANLIRRLS